MSDKKFPSFWQQVNNAIDAIKKLNNDKYKLADEETIRNRSLICQDCEFRDVKTNRCSICGCFCQAKVIPNSQSCPKGKW